MIPVTLACPPALMDDAADLAACFGTGPADARTFEDAPLYPGPGGVAYAAPSGLVTQAVLDRVAQPPQRPDWDEQPYSVNLTGAGRAYAALTVWSGDGPVPQAAPDRIVAVVGLPPVAALTAMGLAR